MSVVAEEARPYTIGANLIWFAIVYAIIIAVVSAAAWALENVGVTLPSAGLGVATFLGAVTAAGGRYAKKVDGAWTRGERGRLAFGYTIVAALVSIALCAVVLSLIAAMGLGDEVTGTFGLVGQYAVVAIFAAAVVFAMYYLGARFLLGGIAKRFVGNSPEPNRTFD